MSITVVPVISIGSKNAAASMAWTSGVLPPGVITPWPTSIEWNQGYWRTFSASACGESDRALRQNARCPSIVKAFAIFLGSRWMVVIALLSVFTIIMLVPFNALSVAIGGAPFEIFRIGSAVAPQGSHSTVPRSHPKRNAFAALKLSV